MNIYRSPYEAYPFLSEPSDDLRCDFEILTDRIASEIGLLASLCTEKEEELLRLGELVYHANPTLRTKWTVTKEEVDRLFLRVQALQDETRGCCERFVLPAGSTRACIAHVLRTDGKALTRMVYRHVRAGHEVDNGLLDFVNLLSGYFFALALWLNREDGVHENAFVSRNYPAK